MSQATGLPSIYAETPILLAPHQIIASFLVNTFLENLAIAPDGTLFVTNHEVGQILRADLLPDASEVKSNRPEMKVPCTMLSPRAS